MEVDIEIDPIQKVRFNKSRTQTIAKLTLYELR